MMLTLLDLSPLLAVVVLMATRRVDVLAASLVSVLLAIGAVAATRLQQPDGPTILPFVVIHTLRGSWLAWQAVVLMIGGYFFFECLRLGGSQFGGSLTPSYRRVFLVCVFLGPFFEVSTGFGVGLLLTLGFLRSMGLRGAPAIMLGLYSQMLAPWGALGLSMVLGAHLADISVTDLGVNSAILLLPLLLVELLVYWRTAAHIGFAPTARDCWEDLGWVVAGGLGMVAANAFLPFDLAVIAPFGLITLLLLYRADALPHWRASLPATGPYIAVSTLLILTRLVPGVPDRLRTVRLTPFVEAIGYEPLYNPSFWLVLVGAIVLLRAGPGLDAAGNRWTPGSRLIQVCRAMTINLWKPALVTALFLIVAQLMGASGIARTLAERFHEVAGPFAILTGPILPGLIGFLSASNTASNSMLMPVQAALGGKAGVSVTWLAALQNVAGGQFCPLSPVRATMGCALMADGTRENAVYGEGWPLLLMSAAVLFAEALLLMVL